MSKVAATPPTPLRAFWLKWRFHINVLLLLVPLGFMPSILPMRHCFAVTWVSASGWPEKYRLAPEPDPRRVPQRGPSPDPAGSMKFFNAALCDTCADQVKATYLRIGKPRSLRAAGVIFFGTPYRMGALPVPERTPADAELWVTMEGWGRHDAPGFHPARARPRLLPSPG